MRYFNVELPNFDNIDLSADYANRDDLNWEWNPKRKIPMTETETVGEFSVNEEFSPEDYRIYQAVGGDMDQFKSVKAYIEHPGGAMFSAPEGSIFREDDIRIALRDHRFDYKIVREPKPVPMPIIKHYDENNMYRPPLIVTTDWYCEKAEAQAIQNAKNHKLDQIDAMELIIERDRIRDKLGLLDRRKPKDAKRILKLNCKLRDIDAQIKWLEDACGKHNQKVDYGSTFGRKCRRIKEMATKAGRAVKKVVKKTIKKVGDFFQFDDKCWAAIGQCAVVAFVGIVSKNFAKLGAFLFG